MAELKDNNIKEAKFSNLIALFDELSLQHEIISESKDHELILIANLKILTIANKFSKIDEELIRLVGSKEISGTYFTEVLTLETLRLRFKEEITKCESLKQIQT